MINKRLLASLSIPLGLTLGFLSDTNASDINNISECVDTKPVCENVMRNRTLEGLVTLNHTPYIELQNQYVITEGEEDSDKKIVIRVKGSFGSGVAHGGFILTANHVISMQDSEIEEAEKYLDSEVKEYASIVTADDEILKIMKWDYNIDGAILKIPPGKLTGLASIVQSFMPLKDITSGQEVYYYQNPHSESGAPKYFTKANVSAVFTQQRDVENVRSLICMDKGVDGGTSGSGLFDYKTGKLMGIIIENHNFGRVDRACAIPIDYFVEVLDKIKSHQD